ncbi:MAG: PspC domain-containing protein [candidate division Zixibacteria bacterium]|nr:PspC domain-containing protein [candidate division Zixibacteria bacterium]
MTKRLYRSTQSRVIAGVCGGIGEYFDIDPVLIRIGAVILTFAHGIGLIAYVVAWIAMPKLRPETVVEPQPKPEPSPLRKYLPGLFLIGLGLIFLLDRIFWWFRWSLVWPSLLILVGLAVLFSSIKRSQETGGMRESVES